MDDCYSFGPFVLSPAERKLLREGEPVELEAKPFDMLISLLRRPGRLVRLDTLHAENWPDAHVQRRQVTTCISKIRSALGDDPKAPRYVENERGQGYRFIEAVTATKGAESRGDEPHATAPDTPDDTAAGARQRIGAMLISVPPPPPLVVGRDTAVSDLHRLLHEGQAGSGPSRNVTVIAGLPGVGKTTLATAIAHLQSVRELFPDGVFWASLGQSPNVVAELRHWSLLLGVADAVAEDSAERIRLGLAALLARKRFLLVLDDVWEAVHAEAMLVGGAGSATLITTRLPRVADALPRSRLYRLGLLAEQPALDLLDKLAPGTSRSHPTQALGLVNALERLPLALQVAGRLLRAEARNDWGVSELLEELQDAARLLEEHAPPDIQGGGYDAPITVRALLRKSTDVLDAVSQQCFAYLAPMAPKPATFDLEALTAIWQDMCDAKAMARRLAARGLIEPVGQGRFWVHALLIAHAKTLLVEGPSR